MPAILENDITLPVAQGESYAFLPKANLRGKMSLSMLRLQNYPVIEFATAGEWMDFLSRSCAPLRIEATAPAQEIAWRMNVAQLERIGVAFGLHGSPLVLLNSGAGSGLQLYFPLTGRADLVLGGNSFTALPGEVLLVDLSQAGRLSVPASFSAIVLDIPETTVQEQFAVRGQRYPLPGGPDAAIDPTSVVGAALMKVTEALVDGLESGLFKAAPLAAESLTQAVLALVTEIALSGRLGESSPSEGSIVIAPRSVRRAIEVMRARIDEPLTTADIAAASQTSVRSLQRTFKDVKGESPLAYLKQLRLQAVHAELTDPAGRLSVAEIATKWGFTHVSRFSSDYRAAFGRLPSEDLRVARQS